MTRLKFYRTLTMALVIMFVALPASAETRHVVERGETLESIAAKYGVTTRQIIELNPDAGTFTYVGMELIIPEGTQTPQNSPVNTANTQAVPDTPSTTAYTSTQSYAPSQTANSHPVMTGSGAEHTVFDMTASLNWVYCVTGSGGDFKSRSCYGVTIEGASKITDSLGAGLFFSGYANYGLMDSSSAGVQFALGPTGVLSLNSSHTLGFHLPLCVGVGYVEKTNWSFITSPHFSALFNRTSVSLGCLVNVASATSASIYIGIGYQF